MIVWYRQRKAHSEDKQKKHSSDERCDVQPDSSPSSPAVDNYSQVKSSDILSSRKVTINP